LSQLPKQPINPNLLVGFDTADDAGVFRLSDDLALVQTVDFFTPIVDDPYVFGQIAAVNSLSDIWAMGAEPLTALSIAAFPKEGLDLDILRQVLEGGQSKLTEAGVVILGGHTVQDPEIKFGYSITGTIHPSRIVTNAGARPGDALILTKPLGTGIISTALKFNKAQPEMVEASINVMLQFNREAARVMQEVGVHSATDITGFGFLGHAYEMAKASKVTLIVNSDSVPLLPGVLDLARRGVLNRGNRTNRDYVGDNVRFSVEVPDELKAALFDPQTSGGLLISAPTENIEKIIESLDRKGQTAQKVGKVTEFAEVFISVV